MSPAVSEVFSLLADDAGIVVNPFAQIPKPTMDKEPRQPFTESELQTIKEKFDPFIEPLFIIAMATAHKILKSSTYCSRSPVNTVRNYGNYWITLQTMMCVQLLN